MKRDPDTIAADAQRIADLGGAAKVAELLGFERRLGGVQRVHNWTVRGVPPEIKLTRPDLFPVRTKKHAPKAAEAA